MKDGLSPIQFAVTAKGKLHEWRKPVNEATDIFVELAKILTDFSGKEDVKIHATDSTVTQMQLQALRDRNILLAPAGEYLGMSFRGIPILPMEDCA